MPLPSVSTQQLMKCACRDYRASWIRDSSFTLYALIRLGFTHEANAYTDFIFERVKQKNPDGSLKIMYAPFRSWCS